MFIHETLVKFLTCSIHLYPYTVQTLISDAVIQIGDDPDRNNPSCSAAITAGTAQNNDVVEVHCNLVGRYISISMDSAKYLTVCEVRAFAGTCFGK